MYRINRTNHCLIPLAFNPTKCLYVNGVAQFRLACCKLAKNGSTLFRENLQREGVVRIAEGSPERCGVFVRYQDIDSQSLGLRPNSRTKNLDGAAPNSLPATMSNHKELPQVNRVGMLTEQRIGNDLFSIFKNNPCVFASQPAPHSLLEFRDAHAIAMSLVANQLVV